MLPGCSPATIGAPTRRSTSRRSPSARTSSSSRARWSGSTAEPARAPEGRPQPRLRHRVAQRRVDDRCPSLPGAEHHALAVKPFEHFLAHCASPSAWRWSAPARRAPRSRWRCATAARRSRSIRAPLQPPALGERVIPRLRKRKVDFRPGMPVTRSSRAGGDRRRRARQAFDLVLLATGARAIAWLKRLGLATDERGFALVHPTLQSVSHPEVFVLGDCATLRDSPHPKSGVYAVRHGELLDREPAAAVQRRALATLRAAEARCSC